MYSYDSDYYRQCYRERMAQLRADYQQAAMRPAAKAVASMAEYARSAWSRRRWPSARRARAAGA
jgi:hypothetical protein